MSFVHEPRICVYLIVVVFVCRVPFRGLCFKRGGVTAYRVSPPGGVVPCSGVMSGAGVVRYR